MFDPGEEVLIGSFSSYLAEGDKLSTIGNFVKALVFYNKALEIEKDNPLGLVARSKCYLQLGDAQSSLNDAEASLADNKEYYRGLFQKAEALYHMGDFEFALVFYHRGNKLRPELDEFRLGIQKAQEAIDNCVGSPSSVKLESKGDLSFFDRMDEGKTPGRSQYRATKRTGAGKGNRQQTRVQQNTSNKTIKAMLGELYADKEYLEKLKNDDDLKVNSNGVNIHDLVIQGIDYLNTRAEFWRQQKPMYARKRDQKLLQGRWSSRPEKDIEPTSFILKNLEQIDRYLAEDKANNSLQLAKTTLGQVDRMSVDILPNKDDVMANLHSCIGNAYLELGKNELALKHHQKDLEYSNNCRYLDAKSRALDNLGRVYARIGEFKDAINYWEEKIPLTRSSLESTWLFHEIGRCYYELEQTSKAKEYGEKSLEEAKKAGDEVWQLNASVLIAQSQTKLGEFGEAIESFRSALDMARLQNDEAAQSALSKALDDVTLKKSKELREADEEANEVDPLPSDDEDEKDDSCVCLTHNV